MLKVNILGLLYFLCSCQVLASGSVIRLKSAESKMHASGAKVVFLAHLTVPAHGKVPLHRDKSEEFLYVLEGTGDIWIDGEKFSLSPNSAIYMPANAEVRFTAGPLKVKVLQFFAPKGPEKKYNTWSK